MPKLSLSCLLAMLAASITFHATAMSIDAAEKVAVSTDSVVSNNSVPETEEVYASTENEPIEITLVGSAIDGDSQEAATDSRADADDQALSADQPGLVSTVSEDDAALQSEAQGSLATEGDTGIEMAMELPGEEVNFKLKLFSSSHHLINGRASSDLGKLRFKSRLMPSNEVKLAITLKQRELKDLEFQAYFDLVNFEMELDGANSVLSREHKEMMSLVATHLGVEFGQQYEGSGLPEHALMLVQMLSYWSASPEGFVHEKRVVVSQ